MTRLAAFVSPGRSLDRTLNAVGLADVLGYDTVFTNHIANRDALVTLASYSRVSSRARLGTAVYPAFTIAPSALGQLAASIDEFIEGRLVLGIGTSHREMIEGIHGLDFPELPGTAMREIVTVLRQLFATGAANVDGEYVRTTFSLHRFEPRADLPIYVAALGPKMLRLAGELADGVILWMATPGYVRDVVVPNLAKGARRAGRDPGEVEVVAAVPCGVAGDPHPLRAAFRRTLMTYLSLPFYRRIVAAEGFGEDLERLDAAKANGDLDAAQAGISDELVDSLAGLGSAERVRAKLEEYRAAGATLPALSPVLASGAASVEQVLLVAAGHEARVA